MYKQSKQIAIALIMLLAAVSPVLFAQDKPPNNPTARNTGSTTGEGQILWQYNTDG